MEMDDTAVYRSALIIGEYNPQKKKLEEHSSLNPQVEKNSKNSKKQDNISSEKVHNSKQEIRSDNKAEVINSIKVSVRNKSDEHNQEETNFIKSVGTLSQGLINMVQDMIKTVFSASQKNTLEDEFKMIDKTFEDNKNKLKNILSTIRNDNNNFTLVKERNSILTKKKQEMMSNYRNNTFSEALKIKSLLKNESNSALQVSNLKSKPSSQKSSKALKDQRKKEIPTSKDTSATTEGNQTNHNLTSPTIPKEKQENTKNNQTLSNQTNTTLPIKEEHPASLNYVTLKSSPKEKPENSKSSTEKNDIRLFNKALSALKKESLQIIRKTVPETPEKFLETASHVSSLKNEATNEKKPFPIFASHEKMFSIFHNNQTEVKEQVNYNEGNKSNALSMKIISDSVILSPINHETEIKSKELLEIEKKINSVVESEEKPPEEKTTVVKGSQINDETIVTHTGKFDVEKSFDPNDYDESSVISELLKKYSRKKKRNF